MVRGTDAAGQADEKASDSVANPHTQPALPPRQATDARATDHGRGDHPGVDIERVGDPEADEIPSTPLPALWFDCAPFGHVSTLNGKESG